MTRQNRCSKWIRKSTRFAIYARDGFKCVYCKSKERLTLDHYKAGNNHTHTNLLTACISCNARRKNKTIRQWFAELRLCGLKTEAIRSRIWRRLSKPLDRVLGRELSKTCARV